MTEDSSSLEISILDDVLARNDYSVSDNVIFLINDDDDVNIEKNSERLSVYNSGTFFEDGGATVIIIKDEELFTKDKFRRLMKYINVNGVGSAKLLCEGIGYLCHPFQHAVGFYVPSFKLNILGEIALRRAGYGVIQHNNSKDPMTDVLSIFRDDGYNESVTFTRGVEGLWCYEASECNVKAFLVVEEKELMGSFDNVKVVVSDLMKLGYNASQITQLFRVQELHKRLGYMSTHKMQLLVAYNQIKNVDAVAGKVTEKVILAYARDAHGRMCPGCTGKAIADKAIPLDPIFAVGDCIKAHGDFFYVMAKRLGLPSLKGNFMLFLDEKSKLFLVFPVANDKEEEVARVMSLLIAFYKRYKHTLQIIRFDNAKLFSERAKFLNVLRENNISVESCDPDRHVRLVEAAIGYLKRTFRCLLAGLNYKFPPKLYQYVVAEAANKINMSPNKSNRVMTPWQLFTGEQPDALYDLRFNFGELVLFFKQAKSGTATDEGREKVGIILGKREASRSGAMWVYDIDGEVVTAVRQCRIFAGTDEQRRDWYSRIVRVGNGDKYVLVEDIENNELEKDINEEFETKPGDTIKIAGENKNSIEGGAGKDSMDTIDATETEAVHKVSVESSAYVIKTDNNLSDNACWMCFPQETEETHGDGDLHSTLWLESSRLDNNNHGDGGFLHENAKGLSRMHESQSEWNSHGDGHRSYGDTKGPRSHSRTSGSQHGETIGHSMMICPKPVFRSWMSGSRSGRNSHGDGCLWHGDAEGRSRRCESRSEWNSYGDGGSQYERSGHGDGYLSHGVVKGLSRVNCSQFEWNDHGDGYPTHGDVSGPHSNTFDLPSEKAGNDLSLEKARDDVVCKSWETGAVQTVKCSESRGDDMGGGHPYKSYTDMIKSGWCKGMKIEASDDCVGDNKAREVMEGNKSDNNFSMIIEERPEKEIGGGVVDNKMVSEISKLESVSSDKCRNNNDNVSDDDRLVSDMIRILSIESNTLSQESEKLANLMSIFSAITTSEKSYGIFETKKGVIEEILQLIETSTLKFISPDVWKSLNKDGYKQALPSTLVIKAKYNVDNVFLKVKARLVCLGNLQKLYNTILGKSTIESPTCSIQSVFIICAIAAKSNIDLATFDIKGAFLHAPIDEEVYVRIGKDVAAILCEHNKDYMEFLQNDGTMIVQLEKFLYGLKKAPRAWYEVIKKVILDIGFTSTSNDTCCFVRHKQNNSSYLVLYVDDMLLAASKEYIDEFHFELTKHFGMENVTAYKNSKFVSFLGMKIEKSAEGIKVNQKTYIENLLEDEDALDLKREFSTPHPVTFSQDHTKDTSPKSTETDYYRKTVMKLMFLAVRTRPDILLDIVVLAGRFENPTIKDVAVLRRILVYVYQTRESGLIYKEGDWDFWASIDASFNTYANGKGHSGFLLFLDKLSACILAKSLMQKVVSNSSTQAELICLNEAVLHILYIADILKELLPGIKVFPIKIHNDNQSMITLVKQPVVNRQGRSKFMNRALFKVNENVEAGEIVMIYENTEDLVADFLTKAVHGERFKIFRARVLGMSNNKEIVKLLGKSKEEVDRNVRRLLLGEKENHINILYLEAESSS